MRCMPHNHQGVARRAFTLVELLVTIAIIAVLLFLGTVVYHKAAVDSQEKLAKAQLTALANAVQLYYQEHRDYPPMRLSDIGNPATGFTVPLSVPTMVRHSTKRSSGRRHSRKPARSYSRPRSSMSRSSSIAR